jgi:hypothetical protein
VVVLPEAKRELRFRSGYGPADLSATLNSAMIASLGQKTDTKVPETFTAIAALGTAFKIAKEGAGQCIPNATLYPITNGVPDRTHALKFDVQPPSGG